MNPLVAGILLALVLAVVVALLLGELVVPRRVGLRWGAMGMYAAAYWYTLQGGSVVVRLVLDLVPVVGQREHGAMGVSEAEVARGRIIGVLERAIALTLVLLASAPVAGSAALHLAMLSLDLRIWLGPSGEDRLTRGG